MKNSKAFYRSALATAIVMALSAPAFATDSTVSTDPVTLNTEKTTLDQDAAFRVGAGVQADITKNMGAYASLDYTKGDDIENPLQGVVGINVTW